MPEASANSIRALLEIGLPAKGNSPIDKPCHGSDFCIMGNQFPNSTHFVEIPKYQFIDHSGLDRVVYIYRRAIPWKVRRVISITLIKHQIAQW
ncbi:hypothetical protein OGZ01_22270 [Vibrio harveyi]|nr:hypothetical protein [Vibrio harveyi]